MVKILICGDVKGELNLIKTRVETLNNSKHGPFECIFCVGDFFGNVDPNSLTEQLQDSDFPIPLYFMCPSEILKKLKSMNFASNVHMLQNSGVLTLPSNQLRIAYINNNSATSSMSQYPVKDVETLLQHKDDTQNDEKQQTIDLFFTPTWPQNINKYDATTSEVTLQSASEQCAALCTSLRPRYHFSGSENIFCQPPPFRNGPGVSFTRFVGLADVQDTKDPKKKWMHALSLEPLNTDATPNTIPPGMTESPFVSSTVQETIRVQAPPPGGLSSATMQRITEEEAARGKSSHYFYQETGNRTEPPRKRRRQQHKKNIAPRADCWYCIASPACEKHLIVSVADDCFLSLPKGGVSAQHVQILPIAHEDCFATLETDTLIQAIRYKRYIIEYFASFGCIALFFERNVILNKAMQRHAFLDVIPIPVASAAAVKAIIESEAQRARLRLDPCPLPSIGADALPELGAEWRDDGLARLTQHIGDASEEYLYIEVSGNAFPPSLATIMEEDGGGNGQDGKKILLPLHFGRQVACRILGCMNRVDWQVCVVPESIETSMKETFKLGFQGFDQFN